MECDARYLPWGRACWGRAPSPPPPHLPRNRSTAAEPRRGGILNFAVSAEPPNYDCHANTSFAFVHPVRPSYNTLMRFVPDAYP